MYLKYSQIENFTTGIQSTNNVKLDVTRSEFKSGGIGIIVGSSINLFENVYLKYEGNTMAAISQIGLEIRAVSNILNIGSWQSDTNIFDNCGIGIKISNSIKVFISRTKIINSTDLGMFVQYYSGQSFKSIIFRGLGKDIETLSNNRNGHIHIMGYSSQQAIVEITDSKILTINENSSAISWSGVLIKNLNNPFIRVENNTFVCNEIFFEIQGEIKHNLDIQYCNTLLAGSRISSNQFDMANLKNCRALYMNFSSPYKIGDFVISDNVVTGLNNESCIFHFLGCDKFECKSNYFNIDQNSEYFPNLLYIIHHASGSKAVIESNVIVDHTKFREGIYIEAVDDKICNNSVYGCNQGIYIDGTGMEIYSNGMNDNTIGLTVNKVKPQRHTGNYWLGSNAIEGKCKSDPVLSRFYSSNTNYGQSIKKYWPTIVTSGWFFHHDTTTPNDCIKNLPFRYFLIDSFRIMDLSVVEKWENDRLFIKTVLDSPQYLQNSDVYDYNSHLESSNLYKIVNFDREIERRTYIPDSLSENYNFYINKFRQSNVLYKARYDIVVLNDSLEYFHDSVLNALSEINENYQDSIEAVNLLLDTGAVLLILDSLVIAIEPTNYLESCEKNLLLLKLKVLKGLAYDSTDINYLESIVDQCDTTYGLLKVAASALLSVIVDSEGYSNQCIAEFLSGSNELSFNKNNYRYFNHKIYFDSEFSVVEFEIYNLNGQRFKLKLNCLENFVDVQDLNAGYWLFRAFGKNGIIAGSFFKS